MDIAKNPKPKSPTEAQLQTACLTWFKAQHPTRLIFHIPNGGSRHPLEAKHLKAQGVRKGIPDLFIPEPCTNAAGLFIEMKRDTRQKPRPEQAEMLAALNNKGYAVALCGNFEHFQKVVNEYFDPKSWIPMFKPKDS